MGTLAPAAGDGPCVVTGPIAVRGARSGTEAVSIFTPIAADATDFEITQVVDLVTGVHARIRVAELGAVHHG